MKTLAALAVLALMSTSALPATALARPAAPAVAVPAAEISDAALLKTLPGFTESFATVNGVRLHYVVGGEGKPLVLLPGWPETWWSYHQIMPALAKDHRVIVVDLRGMGQSDKPADGYDKKTMAKDIHELVLRLGYAKADVAGHDIGSMVAFAYAANFPQAAGKVVMMDVAHPDKGLATWPLLPAVGTFGDRIDDDHPYPWWFAFHQVKGMPEELLEGRTRIELEWFFRYLLKNDAALDARDRAVYAAAYDSREAIRAGNAWYQAFPQDIVDDGTYGKITVPILALGGPGYAWLKGTMTGRVDNLQVVKVEGSGHFIPEEKPRFTIDAIEAFLK